jgi:hypothetical protein
MFSIGYISGKTNWRASSCVLCTCLTTYPIPKTCTSSKQCGVSTNLTVDSAVQDDWKGIFENYTVGVGVGHAKFLILLDRRGARVPSTQR